MNEEEKRILHGLYYDTEMVGERRLVSSGEILWLAASPLPQGRKWRNEKGGYKSLNNESDKHLAGIGLTSAASQRPIRYLSEQGYLTYQIKANLFDVAVTASGADIARKLDSWKGRADLWYQENKNGILWFFVTIAVSAITSILVNVLTKK